MATDLYFVETDRHRVVLLAKLLARLGVHSNLLNSSPARPADTLLVACTSAALREPWLQDVLGAGSSVVALLFDEVELPRSCRRAVDLTSWPARSADAEVDALVRWLKRPEADPEFGVPAARRRIAGGRRWARSTGDGPSPWFATTLLAGLLAGLALLLWSTSPGDEAGAGEAPSPVLAAADELESAAEPVAVTEQPDHLTESGVEPMTVDQAAGSDQVADSAARQQPGLQAEPAGRVSRQGNDSLSRLCRAAGPASAAAWLAVLNWKQRLRLEDAACVQRLAARPGFESFAALLEARPG